MYEEPAAQCDRPALGQDSDGRVPIPEHAAQHAQGLAQGNTQQGQQVKQNIM